VDKSFYQALLIGLEGHELSGEEEYLLSEYSPGGVILFGRNIGTAEQAAGLCAKVHELCELPPIIAIDQEGGLVDRLRRLLSTTISPVELATYGTPGEITRYGEITGCMLRALGINLNLAPVVDICLSSEDNGLQGRQWGVNSESVAGRAEAFLAGMTECGIPGCLKHFPGLGRARVDSHKELPVVTSSREDLLSIDMVPYRKLVAGVPVVLVAHCRYIYIDGEDGPPASTSPNIYRLLREEIGFEGIAMTDDIEMGALDVYPVFTDRLAAALNAGADLLPICNDPLRISAAFELLERIIDKQLVPKERLRDAAERVMSIKSKFVLPFSPDPHLTSRFAMLDEQLAELRRELTLDESKI
jgi:beta-N-acetylhexosaminidase